ncbi:MAG: hypothetical protein JW741_04145 [Sedimentisphaerales bacterium]|nr:hypothetical protein [Sedimentisphaerales bacterium]
MGISHQDALESLDLIQDTTRRVRRAVAAGYAGNLLILWGFVWIAAFTGVHFAPHRAGLLWGILDGLGIIGTIVICRTWPVRSRATGDGLSMTARRMIVFWLALFAYASLWIVLLRPASGMLLGTFLVTVAMLGYVVVGLWSGSSFLIWLGLAVTGLTLCGFYLVPAYFNLWMALTGGGALLGTGLHIRIRWR